MKEEHTPASASPISEPAEAPARPQVLSEHSPDWFKARKLFFVVLAIWLVSLPAISILQFIVQFVLSGGNEGQATEIIKFVVNVVSLIGGIFGVLGWIPVLILGIMWSKKK